MILSNYYHTCQNFIKENVIISERLHIHSQENNAEGDLEQYLGLIYPIFRSHIPNIDTKSELHYTTSLKFKEIEIKQNMFSDYSGVN